MALALLGLCACGVHKPVDWRFASDPADDQAPQDVSLLGAPSHSSSTAESRQDGFILVGGPPAHATRAIRALATSAGFEIAAADEAPVARPSAASTSAPDTGAGASARDAAPAADHKPSNVGGASVRAPARANPAEAEGPARLEAFTLLPERSDLIRTTAPPRSPAIGLGQALMFLLVLLAAGGLWVWHRRCLHLTTDRSA
jgi:hypothetical protein